MAGQPPPAEQHLKDEYGDTSQKNEMFKIVDQHYGQHCKASQSSTTSIRGLPVEIPFITSSFYVESAKIRRSGEQCKCGIIKDKLEEVSLLL